MKPLDLSPRQNTPQLLLIWLTANLVVTTFLTGTLFVPQVSLFTALGLIGLGTVCGSVVLVLVGNIGTLTGHATMSLTQQSFGRWGSLVPVGANVVVLMGWSWVQAMLAGLALNFMLERTVGYSNPVLCAVLCQVLVVAISLAGHAWVSKVEPVLGVVILVVFALIVVKILGLLPLGELNAVGSAVPEPGARIGVFDVVFATAASWTVLAADFNRYARTPRVGVVGSGVGYTLSTVISMGTGLLAFTYIFSGDPEAAPFDPTPLMEMFGLPLALAIFVSVTATNSMVFYSMSVSVLDRLPAVAGARRGAVALLGVVSVAGATAFPLLGQFTTFLTVIGAFFIPIFAIMVVDFYGLKRRQLGDVVSFNAVAVVSWFLGAVVSYVLTYVWVSPVGATLPVFVVTALAYAGLSKVFGVRKGGPVGLAG